MPPAAEYRKRQIYGLLLVAAIVLLLTWLRAAPQSIFPTGWWRVW